MKSNEAKLVILVVQNDQSDKKVKFKIKMYFDPKHALKKAEDNNP